MIVTTLLVELYMGNGGGKIEVMRGEEEGSVQEATMKRNREISWERYYYIRKEKEATMKRKREISWERY